MSDFFAPGELLELGFKDVSPDALVSRRALIINPSRISVGRFSRVDAFCILSGSEDGLVIGRNVHIGAQSTIMGRGRVVLEDFVGVSVRCSIFSSNEDYSGASLTNPAVPEEFRKVDSGPVIFRSHAILGAGSIVLPNVTIGRSTAIGALSLVRRDVPEGVIAIGAPLRIIGKRKLDHLDLAANYLAREGDQAREAS